MKKLLILSIALLASFAFVAAAGAEDMAFTGWVADEACAKDFEKAGNEEHVGCATGCLSGGGGVALASPDGFHLLDITNEKALEQPRDGGHGDGDPRRGDQHHQGDLDQGVDLRNG